MNVLGLSYLAADTSATLMINGEVIACCEEERYSLEKHTRLFPINAIKDVMKIGNLTIDDIDTVAIGFDPDLYHNYTKKNSINRRPLPSRSEVAKEIKDKLNYSGEIDFHKHHLAHAASSFYSSGYKKSLIFSNDGIGEVSTSLIAIGEGLKIKPISENFFPNSIGLAYAAITRYLGWGPGDEGIVMGLAPYGNNKNIIPNTNLTYESIFNELIKEDLDKFNYYINDSWFSFPFERDTWVTEKFISLFGKRREKDGPINQSHMDIAASIQTRIEEVLLNQLRLLKKETNISHLCISGGVGLNCSLNGKIESSGIFDEIFIPSASGDNGISLGACFLSSVNKNVIANEKKIISFSLGSNFSDDSIEKEIKNLGCSYTKPKNLYKYVAKQLHEKKIIGWFQGGSEFGPRALGNRSILTSPFPKSMKDYVNNQVKFREDFRPFAPAVLKEKINTYFDIKQDSPFMLIACKAKKNKISDIPAVIHVDQSARVQTVSEETNPYLYQLLKEFDKLTKIPVLLNTSFNIKGQPIVNSPKDAIKTFLNNKIDILAIGSFVLKK